MWTSIVLALSCLINFNSVTTLANQATKKVNTHQVSQLKINKQVENQPTTDGNFVKSAQTNIDAIFDLHKIKEYSTFSLDDVFNNTPTSIYNTSSSNLFLQDLRLSVATNSNNTKIWLALSSFDHIVDNQLIQTKISYQTIVKTHFDNKNHDLLILTKNNNNYTMTRYHIISSFNMVKSPRYNFKISESNSTPVIFSSTNQSGSQFTINDFDIVNETQQSTVTINSNSSSPIDFFVFGCSSSSSTKLIRSSLVDFNSSTSIVVDDAHSETIPSALLLRNNPDTQTVTSVKRILFTTPLQSFNVKKVKSNGLGTYVAPLIIETETKTTTYNTVSIADSLYSLNMYVDNGIYKLSASTKIYSTTSPILSKLNLMYNSNFLKNGTYATYLNETSYLQVSAISYIGTTITTTGSKTTYSDTANILWLGYNKISPEAAPYMTLSNNAVQLIDNAKNNYRIDSISYSYSSPGQVDLNNYYYDVATILETSTESKSLNSNETQLIEILQFANKRSEPVSSLLYSINDNFISSIDLSAHSNFWVFLKSGAIYSIQSPLYSSLLFQINLEISGNNFDNIAQNFFDSYNYGTGTIKDDTFGKTDFTPFLSTNAQLFITNQSFELGTGFAHNLISSIKNLSTNIKSNDVLVTKNIYMPIKITLLNNNDGYLQLFNFCSRNDDNSFDYGIYVKSTIDTPKLSVNDRSDNITNSQAKIYMNGNKNVFDVSEVDADKVDLETCDVSQSEDPSKCSHFLSPINAYFISKLFIQNNFWTNFKLKSNVAVEKGIIKETSNGQEFVSEKQITKISTLTKGIYKITVTDNFDNSYIKFVEVGKENFTIVLNPTRLVSNRIALIAVIVLGSVLIGLIIISFAGYIYFHKKYKLKTLLNGTK